MDDPRILDTIRSCRFCFMCRHACPTFLATKLDSHTPRGYALLLSEVHEGLRDWSGDLVARFYQCSQCGLCRADCGFHWPEDELVRHGREEIVAAGRAPGVVERVCSSIINHGTPYESTPEERRAPANEAPTGGVSVLFFAGCSTRRSHPEIVSSVAAVLDAIGIDWIQLEDEACCGMPLIELGYPSAARQAALSLAAVVSSVHPKVLLTGCPHCHRMFVEMLPALGADLPSDIAVMHTSQYVDKAISNSELRLAGGKVMSPVGYHDPCQLGRKAGIFDAPRRVIAAATGAPPVELFHNMEKSECCGAGSAMHLTYPEVTSKVARRRLAAASEGGVGVLATACQNCKAAFSTAGQETLEKIETIDIMELVARSLE